MKPVSDGFLFTVAQIAATLIGLLLVAVVFYVETGFRRLESLGPQAGPFLRAMTKLVLGLYALVLGVSLGLVVLERWWVTAVFSLLGLAVLWALFDVTRDARGLPPRVRARHGQVWVAWPVVVATLAVPWVAEGADPGRPGFTWTIVLAGTLAFALTAALLLLTFDLASIDAEAREDDES